MFDNIVGVEIWVLGEDSRLLVLLLFGQLPPEILAHQQILIISIITPMNIGSDQDVSTRLTKFQTYSKIMFTLLLTLTLYSIVMIITQFRGSWVCPADPTLPICNILQEGIVLVSLGIFLYANRTRLIRIFNYFIILNMLQITFRLIYIVEMIFYYYDLMTQPIDQCTFQVMEFAVDAVESLLSLIVFTVLAGLGNLSISVLREIKTYERSNYVSDQ